MSSQHQALTPMRPFLAPRAVPWDARRWAVCSQCGSEFPFALLVDNRCADCRQVLARIELRRARRFVRNAPPKREMGAGDVAA